jgi:hypothetical protein
MRHTPRLRRPPRLYLERLLVNASIIETIKKSHVIIISLMLVPLALSLTVFLFNTLSYDRLIRKVGMTNRMNQIVKHEFGNEVWDIVAGNKPFADGDPYRIINRVTNGLDAIMTMTTGRNRQMLEVAGRAVGTLTRYVSRLGRWSGARWCRKTSAFSMNSGAWRASCPIFCRILSCWKSSPPPWKMRLSHGGRSSSALSKF